MKKKKIHFSQTIVLSAHHKPPNLNTLSSNWNHKLFTNRASTTFLGWHKVPRGFDKSFHDFNIRCFFFFFYFLHSIVLWWVHRIINPVFLSFLKPRMAALQNAYSVFNTCWDLLAGNMNLVSVSWETVNWLIPYLHIIVLEVLRNHSERGWVVQLPCKW